MAKLMLHDILIVEDSVAQSKYLADLCQELPVNSIRVAMNGEEAIQLLREQLPSLMLLDLEMPKTDGVQVLQRMAQENLVTPVVVTSAKDLMLLASVELMGRELGLPVLGAVKKPVQLAALQDLLQRLNASVNASEAADDLCSDSDIRLGLDRRQFIPYFQPKVTLHGQVLKGAELLARWRLGDQLVPPSRFIPVIESCGWSTELTLQMLEQALKQWQQWSQRGLRMPMSVNLSALSLNGNTLVPQIEQMVSNSRVPPRYIIFEITETAVAENLAEAMGVAARLRLAGFGLSIDDFGTGFATMQQLTRFPFTELKIDQSLVRSISGKPHLESIVYSVIELAQRMSLTTVAEGIETVDDQLCLDNKGCILGQGYLYAKPLAPEQFESWLRQRLQTTTTSA